jgi:uncharacterized damage-inducible protein DinB
VTLSGAFEPHGDGELATYRAYLDGHRRVLEARCADLSPEQLAARSVPPSDLSLLGLVRHLARVEHNWFRSVIDGHLDEPRLDADDPTGGFHRVEPTAESVAEAFTRWDEQVAYAEACLAQLTDADLGSPRVTRHGEDTTVRDVLVHLVEEYARHNGHADLLREHLDDRADR